MNVYHQQYLFFILIIFCFVQCTKQKTDTCQNVQTLAINPKQINPIKFSNLFSAQEVIKVSNDSINVLSKPSKLLTADNHFYFCSNNILFVYDQEGNCILNINKKGNGPGEYITISDFSIDSDKKLLEINDGEGGKIVRYDMNGNYVGEIKYKLFSSNFVNYRNDLYMYSGRTKNAEKDYSIHILNSETGDSKKKIVEVPAEEKYLNFIEYTNFAIWDDTLSYSSSISNTIYYIKDRELYPRLTIDFGKSALPSNAYHEFTNLSDFVNYINSNKYAARIDGYAENSSFLFFIYTYENLRPFVLFDKKRNKLYHFSNFENDLLFPTVNQRTAYDILPVFMDDNHCYWMIEAYQFLELFNDIKSKMPQSEYDEFIRKNQKLNLIYQNLQPEDNPLILKYKFK